jgi:hypothetical protein
LIRTPGKDGAFACVVMVIDFRAMGLPFDGHLRSGE